MSPSIATYVFIQKTLAEFRYMADFVCRCHFTKFIDEAV